MDRVALVERLELKGFPCVMCGRGQALRAYQCNLLYPIADADEKGTLHASFTNNQIALARDAL